MRIIIDAIFIILFLIISLPIQLVVWLLSFKWPKAPDYVSYPLVGWALKSVTWLSGTKVTYLGKENIRHDEAVLYVGNHRGMFDIVTTYPIINRPAGFLAKKSFAKVPGLNIWMSLMHCVFLDRDDIKQGLQCILKCIDMIKNGTSVVVFPEGTRSKGDSEIQKFHEATMKIATKTKCTIVPMAICNTSAVFEDHKPFIKPAHVIVEFLEPIHLDELTPEDKKNIGAYTREKIVAAYNKNMELI